MGETVGEGMTTQVPLSRRLPLGQVQTGPLGLSRQSHSHFLRSQGLVTAESGEGNAEGWGGDPQPSLASDNSPAAPGHPPHHGDVLQLPKPCARPPMSWGHPLIACHGSWPPLNPPPSPLPPCSPHPDAPHFGQGKLSGCVPSCPKLRQRSPHPLAPRIGDQALGTSLPPPPPGSRVGVPGPARTLWLLVLVVEHNIGGVVEARGQAGDSLVPKLVDLEDAVVDVGDAVDVVLKDVDAKRMAQPWGSEEGTRAGRGGFWM